MLQDELKRMKEELAEKEKQEKVEELKVEEPEQPEEEVEEPEEEIKEEVKEEVKEEKKEEKLDDAGYARLRREAAAEKRRAEQAIKELEELKAAKAEKPVEQPIITPELQPLVEDHRLRSAEREFLVYENKVKQAHPEYNAVTAEYAAAMYQSFKIQNPRKTDFELNEMTKRAILMRAGEYAKAGYENPVEEMYYEAKELGFTGKSFKQEPKEERLQPDMAKVAENRKRSTGMTANNGVKEGQMTLAMAATLPAGEWARLPKAEKQRLLYGR